MLLSGHNKNKENNKMELMLEIRHIKKSSPHYGCSYLEYYKIVSPVSNVIDNGNGYFYGEFRSHLSDWRGLFVDGITFSKEDNTRLRTWIKEQEDKNEQA